MVGAIARLGLAVGAAALAGGCIAAPVAALGVVGQATDIGSAAFSAGTEVFTNGKLETVEFSAFDQADRAIRSTLNDLRLDSHRTQGRKNHAHYTTTDEYGSTTKIDVWKRTSALVDIRVDIGWFGSEAFSRLLLKSIRHRLPAAATAAATRPTSPVDLQKPRTYEPVNTPPSD